MRRAIVVGATGGTGAAITAELVQRGVLTLAFGRSRQRLEELASQLGNPPHLSIASGDAFQSKDVTAAAKEADVLFHCANVPYHEMESKLIPLGESVMAAAQELGLKVIVIDGIYPYGRKQMDQVTEEHPKQPHTKKGKVRLAYEQMIMHPQWSRARAMIVRLPDYYGPSANQASYLGGTLEAIAAGKLAFFIGNMKVPREYVYLPDAAKMVVELAGHDHAYGQNWNIPGAEPISGKEIVRIAQEASGRKKPVISLGRIGLSLLGLVVPVMKEVVEMLYLTEEPLRLSGEKYERRIGRIPVTSPETGIAETIRELQKRAGV
jgi:nucleoside-diphosphate-sugar epimerase